MARSTAIYLPILGLVLSAGQVQAQLSSVSIFHPVYPSSVLNRFWGSVIGSDADKTTYTMFCAPATASNDRCEVVGPLPLTFIEGPKTLAYGGTVTSAIEATVTCTLAETTAATCSGYQSIGSTRIGPFTGPNSTTWTATFSKPAWGVLTLGPAPLTTVVDGTRTSTYFPASLSSSVMKSTTSPTSMSGSSGGSVTAPPTGASSPASTSTSTSTSAAERVESKLVGIKVAIGLVVWSLLM